MRRSVSHRGWSRQAGQSSVLAALLCGMLAVVLAMTANVGKLVTEKIAMQNAIDLSAFSGASTQALYLNKMRHLNDAAWVIAHQARVDMEKYEASCQSGMSFSQATSGSSSPCQITFHDPSLDGITCHIAALMPITGKDQGGADKWAGQQYQNQINSALTAFTTYNTLGYNRSIANAKLAADENYRGLAGFWNFMEGNAGGQGGTMVKVQQSIVNLSYHGWCWNPIVDKITVSIQTTNFQIPGNNGDGLMAWYFKVENGDVLFASKAEGAHPNDRLMDFPTPYFMNGSEPCWNAGNNARPNGNNRCGINVYAAAAPYYGKLGSKGTASGHGDRWNKYGQFRVESSNALNKERPERGACGANPPQGVYCDYRVRFVGLFEDDVDYVGSQMQATYQFVPPQWKPYMRH